MPDAPDLNHLSPSTRTDLGILLLEGSMITDHGDHLVVRSPEQPTYHWGNCLYVTSGDVEDADHWLQVFHDTVPDADWVAIGLPTLPTGDAWTGVGLEPEAEDVLSLRGLPQPRTLPDGYVVRPLTTDEDWAQQLSLEMAEARAEDQQDMTNYEQFCREREASDRRLIEAGPLQWFGAFTTDGELAASMGIVVLGDERRTARYQSVLTSPAHRRKGLAGHLLGVAATWAVERGAEELVIVTELTNPAGRLYRSVGFTPDYPAVGVYRPPARDKH